MYIKQHWSEEMQFYEMYSYHILYNNLYTINVMNKINYTVHC